MDPKAAITFPSKKSSNKNLRKSCSSRSKAKNFRNSKPSMQLLMILCTPNSTNKGLNEAPKDNRLKSGFTTKNLLEGIGKLLSGF